MTADPVCCLPNDNAARAARLMRDEDVGPIPVVSDLHEKRLLGIVTDRDLAVQVVAEGRDPNSVRLEEIMSRRLVTCRAEDDYDRALDAMGRHQIRRIPVVDTDGLLLGIISQADVARQVQEPGEVAEMVEEISEPHRTGLGRLARRSYSTHSHNRESDHSGLSSVLVNGLCIALGAGLAYALDSSRGNARREQVRSKAVTLYNSSGSLVSSKSNDWRNRASGLVSEAQSWWRSEPVEDGKLEQRVRTALGRVSNSHNVQISVKDGTVYVEGSVDPGDKSAVLKCVHKVQGVRNVENRLHVIGEGNPPAPSSHGGTPQWSPTVRLAATALGGGLALYGLRAPGRVRKATGTVGLGLMARGLANRPVTSLRELVGSRGILGL